MLNTHATGGSVGRSPHHSVGDADIDLDEWPCIHLNSLRGPKNVENQTRLVQSKCS